MRYQDIEQQAADVLLAYYANDIMPFLGACHDDVMWIGPAKGQYIHGKTNLMAAFAMERNNLRFDVQDLRVTHLPTGSPSVCDVAFRFQVDTIWPDGTVRRCDQRITVTMVDCLRDPKILLCHISNAIDYDQRDTIYPEHYIDTVDNKADQARQVKPIPEKRLTMRGLNHTTLYLDHKQISHIESSGRHAIIHTNAGTCESVETLAAIAKRTEDVFVRCHVGYLVNPAYVRNISRFQIELVDGTSIPVPEKRFTAVRAELEERLGATPPEPLTDL